MNNCEKREKTINELSEVITEATYPDRPRKFMMPLDLAEDALALLKGQEKQWISVEDGLPQERDTIFAKLYGTDKWKNTMFRKMSDDVRVVKVFPDGTRKVHHDYTVDGVWESERKGSDVYGRVSHWMPNPEIPDI